MFEKFDFRGLFTLDLANNHQGSVEHAKKVINGCGKAAADNNIRAALKFQFRDIPTFVHPDHKKNSDNKHIPRFISTYLDHSKYATLAEAVKKAGMYTMSTPFDEASVDLIEELDLDIVKVASCSAADFPLLERVAESGKPVIISTGGLDEKQIGDVVSFFSNRRVHFAMMHCVSIYPTPDDMLQLNQIDLLKRRYPHLTIGWSTHEDPDDSVPVQMAVAKGAEIFERHVGFETDKVKLNKYSSTPEQLDVWFKAYHKAVTICGDNSGRPLTPDVERNALDGLQRGVFAKHKIEKGSVVSRDDVFFAMPFSPGGLASGRWREGIIAEADIATNKPLDLEKITVPPHKASQPVYSAIHEAKSLLNEARIAIPPEFKLEISHHYGMGNFREYGAFLIDCVNRDYCKKLVIQLPKQYHPAHVHKRKEESFQVLHGVLEIKLDDRRKTLYPGDIVLVQPGVWHEFWTDTGVIFEEISTTHYNNDSFYEDKGINKMARSERKTVVENWGRHQI